MSEIKNGSLGLYGAEHSNMTKLGFKGLSSHQPPTYQSVSSQGSKKDAKSSGHLDAGRVTRCSRSACIDGQDDERIVVMYDQR